MISLAGLPQIAQDAIRRQYEADFKDQVKKFTPHLTTMFLESEEIAPLYAAHLTKYIALSLEEGWLDWCEDNDLLDDTE